MPRRIAPSLLATPALVILLSCSGGGGHGGGDVTSPTPLSDVRLASADVLIDGRSVDGATISAGSGTATLFVATLGDPRERDRLDRMVMEYPVHAEIGMMGSRATLACYDDGTHGDVVAGDGTYSYMDVGDHVGVHRSDCVPGQYVYELHGVDLGGRRTNERTCRVTLR